MVPGAIVWRSVSDGTPTRVLPDGCMDLLWDGERVTVAGPDTVAELHASRAGARMTGLRFAPGYAPLLLGAPAAAFTDDDAPLDALWSPTLVRSLGDQLLATDDAGAVLERVALQRSRAVGAERDHGLSADVARRLREGEAVGAVAEAVGLSARQLQRRSLDAFGYGPKLLARILRMNDALALARDGVPFAAVAATAGYADQAHLARTVRALAGVPLGELVGQPAAS